MSDLSSLPPELTPPNATESTPAPVPLPEPTRDERTLGMLAHVLQIVSWLLAPAIIFLVRKDSRFVRYHALQAVFFQLLVMLAWGATMLALFAGFFTAIARHKGPVGPAAIGFPILFFLSSGAAAR